MEFTFTQQDAQVLFAFLAATVVPFVVSLLKSQNMTPTGSLFIAVVVSAIGAVLSQFAAGALSTGSFIVALIGVFTTAQAHYATWFQSLGFELSLNPWKQNAQKNSIDGDPYAGKT